MILAAIDIGSNALRLLIEEAFVEDGEIHFKKIALTRVPLRLGHDVFTKGLISTGDSAYIALYLLKNNPKISEWLSLRFPFVIIDEAQYIKHIGLILKHLIDDVRR